MAVANARHASPGCAPTSRTVLPPAPGGGKRTRGVYTEGILLWVFPGCCSNVFLWADLTQPGGEVHWSKPVRAKSKGYIPWSNATGLGGTGALGVAMPPERRTGPSYMRGGVVACPKRRDASPERGPPHGRRRRWHLEGGNGRVGSTRMGSCCGSGTDVAPECSYGLT